jgi:hypothetical protein
MTSNGPNNVDASHSVFNDVAVQNNYFNCKQIFFTFAVHLLILRRAQRLQPWTPAPGIRATPQGI